MDSKKSFKIQNSKFKINVFPVIGLMSGTSLDGLDIAYCIFSKENDIWQYNIESATTIPYPEEWKQRLKNVENGSAYDLAKTDADYGFWLGKTVKEFIDANHCEPILIASHGHTIFHRPELGFSTQIGNGNAIHAATEIPTIFDFRSLDVALGGQGAPLVPIGDLLLFSQYDFCLNLGGIANISFQKDEKRIAFDISPCNMALNLLASELNLEYDPSGENARKGAICTTLLEKLNALPYYQTIYPKSIGKEWFLEHFLPILKNSTETTENKLRTVTEHIAFQISEQLTFKEKENMIVTGGGAFNSFLLELLSEKTAIHIETPSPLIINYKEALIFAFLGVLRFCGENNCIASVTGSSKSCSGGVLVG